MFSRPFFVANYVSVGYNYLTMTLEEFCYSIYKHTFAHVLFNGVYAAHVTVRIKKNPFETDELEDAFRKFVRDTPLSNLDLSVVEDASLEEGVLMLDEVELFGDGESVPETLPFHADVKKIQYTDKEA